MNNHLLVFIPTYNERDNVERLCADVLALELSCDILFIDDGSPDGTGEIIDALVRRHANVHVVHREGKSGIGSAHKEGIAYAYAHGYAYLVTMDCDFSHSPADIPRLLEAVKGRQVVVGSRYMEPGSLASWNPMRRLLTMFGHFLTTCLLGIPGDASGALRLYNLSAIPRDVLGCMRSNSYSFFFESLFVFARNGLSIGEIPIVLPARTYGHSKMTLLEALRSGSFLIQLWLQATADPARFRLLNREAPSNTTLTDPQNWNGYWNQEGGATKLVYGVIAAFYRNRVIKRNLEYFLRKHFRANSELLHAGCGSGAVDADLQQVMRITAVDISTEALNLYLRNNPDAYHLEHASIFELPGRDESFDGVYNLGVVEHFTHDEIRKMFREFHRVLRRGGKVVIFWPHHRATSVLALGFTHYVLNAILHKKLRLHPPEISLLSSRQEAVDLLRECGFGMSEYYFGARDLFVQAVVVGHKLPG